MQLNSDMRIVRRWYGYHPRGRRWAVYHYTAYIRDGDKDRKEFSVGDKVSEHSSREEARKEVYRLNGWKYKERGTG